MQWLGELLAPGPLPAREVKHQAWDCGLSTATLRRAMRALESEIQNQAGLASAGGSGLIADHLTSNE